MEQQVVTVTQHQEVTINISAVEIHHNTIHIMIHALRLNLEDLKLTDLFYLKLSIVGREFDDNIKVMQAGK